MALGTESVPAVDRIVGPGNAYVTEAKRQLVGQVGIDGLAGPSELVLVADATADPQLIAADLVTQAEHDPDAVAVFVTTDASQVEPVAPPWRRSPPRRPAGDVSSRSDKAIVVADLDAAAEVVSDIAPNTSRSSRRIGCVPPTRAQRRRDLPPRTTPVPFDYGVASNHVLPTAGTARFASGPERATS
jgi:histidinol dehydrogenase